MQRGAIKVANIIEEGRYGGPHARIALLAREMANMGIETHVICPDRNSDKFIDVLEYYQIPFSRTGLTVLSRHLSSIMRYAFLFPLEVFGLVRILKQGRFDIVHVNGTYQYKGAIAARLCGIPVLWHITDSAMPSPVRGLFRLVAGFCAAGFAYGADCVYKEYLEGSSLSKRQSHKVYVPVDTGVFDPAAVNASGPEEGNAGLKVINVSNINPNKRLEDLIEVAERVGISYPGEVRFIVIGPVYESQREYFKTLLSLVESRGLDNISFLGRVDDVPAALKDADIFMFTSRSESGPIVVFEAMAMGKPVVTTDVGAVSEVIEDGVSGFIVPVGDQRSLEEKLLKLLGDGSLRGQMGAKARDVVVRKVSSRVGAGMLFKAYGEMFKGGRS
jgi:glycosyltransferase involved in cell wall biosynthesis